MKSRKIIFIVAILFSFAVGFFLGMEYKAYQIRSSISETFNTPITQSQKKQQTENKENIIKPTKKEIIKMEINDEVELKTLKFIINDVKETDIISSSYDSPKTANHGSKFVIVKMSITNTTKSGFSFYPDDGFRLIDDQEREYQTYEDTIGNIDNYLNVQELAPSIEKTGVLVYEIPSDNKSYSLNVKKSDTNQIYQIRLK